MKYTLICLLFLISHLTYSQTLQEFYKISQEARKAGDVEKFYDNIIQAHKLHPYHQGILYQCGLAAAMLDKSDEALSYLNRAIQINAGFDLTVDELKSLANREEFTKLKNLQVELQKPVIHSDTAFVIHNRTLHIESVASGETPGVFYFGAIHKRSILRRDRKGKETAFTSPAQDGLASVFGIKVDPKKKVLWACSSPMFEMENYDSTATSAVFKYDISSGKLLSKYPPVSDKKKFVFGDLFLSSKGQVFVSDSENSIIFLVNEKNGKLEEFFKSELFWNIQGLCMSDDGKYLFISDYIKGIFRLELENKELKQLTSGFELSLKAIDGLSFYKNTLIAIQNSIHPMRVTQYILDPSATQLTSYKIIDRAHPAFNEPTIGCVVGNQFYYVANSLWSGYDDQHIQKPVEQLQDVVILKAELEK